MIIKPYRLKTISFCIAVFLCFYAFSQEHNYTLNGYVASLHNVSFDSTKSRFFSNNLLHNRLNFKWFPTNELMSVIEVRNRFYYSEDASNNYLSSSSQYANDNGFTNLAFNLFKGKSFLFNSTIDRANLSYEHDKFKITFGRQRINWSQTWVWNPNDIFNTYSFFDFDYTERPGCDALRIQYFNTEVSVSELALNINKQKQITAASYYKFNNYDFDFQVLGGILNSADYVLGGGFSGAFKSTAIRGEATYLQPIKNVVDTTGVLLASISAEYSFENKLTLMSEFFYNTKNPTLTNSFAQYYSAPLSVKNLSFVKYNFFVQVSYPITPLFQASLAGMIFPTIKGYYLGPSLRYNVSNNIDFSCFWQSFSAMLPKSNSVLDRQVFNVVFLRFKANF